MNDFDLSGDVPVKAGDGIWLACIESGETSTPFDEIRYTCDDCDGLLEVRYPDLPTWRDFQGEGVW